jgi:AcrR family transcriptional regulator
MTAVPLSARDRLIAATTELTYANGIQATGVDAIAREAGVTKRTLYQHFRSKDELVGSALAALDEPAMNALRSAVDRRIAKGSRPLAALFDVLERTFQQRQFRGCAFLSAGQEMRDADHPVRAAVRAHTDKRRAYIKELVRAEGADDVVGDSVVLLVEGAFALAASRRESAALGRARRGAELLLKRQSD